MDNPTDLNLQLFTPPATNDVAQDGTPLHYAKRPPSLSPTLSDRLAASLQPSNADAAARHPGCSLPALFTSLTTSSAGTGHLDLERFTFLWNIDSLADHLACIGDQQTSPLLGHGLTAQVREMFHISASERVAVKFLHLDRPERNDAYARELSFFQKLTKSSRTALVRSNSGLSVRSHEDDVPLEKKSSATIEPSINSRHLIDLKAGYREDTQCVALVMELMAGDLAAAIGKGRDSKKKHFSDRTIATVAAHLLRALRYLHESLGMIHRDLKPSNVLYDTHGTVKLADFGMVGTSPNQEFVGSLLYMAPERLQGQVHTTVSDIWAFGLVVAEMVLGHHLFEPTMGDQFTLSADEKFWAVLEVSAKATSCLPPELKTKNCHLDDFIRTCLNPDPNQRASAAALQQHPFLALNESPDNNDAIVFAELHRR